MNKFGFIFLYLVALFTSCEDSPEDKREKAELKGAELLNQARIAHINGDYQTAIGLIDSIRKAYPLAMEAREQGILLKDSVFLYEARKTLQQAMEEALPDSEIEELQNKITFYLRKLQHDKEQRQTHK